MKVSVEELVDIKEIIKRVDSTPLEELEIYKNGKRLEVSPETIDNWKFIGLSNFHLITYYLK